MKVATTKHSATVRPQSRFGRGNACHLEKIGLFLAILPSGRHPTPYPPFPDIEP